MRENRLILRKGQAWLEDPAGEGHVRNLQLQNYADIHLRNWRWAGFSMKCRAIRAIAMRKK